MGCNDGKTRGENQMKTLVCNIQNPSTQKIAAVTGNKITNIHNRQGILWCKLNGEFMRMSEARKEMLKGVTLVNLHGYPCDV